MGARGSQDLRSPSPIMAPDLICIEDIEDHPTEVTCLPIAVESGGITNTLAVGFEAESFAKQNTW